MTEESTGEWLELIVDKDYEIYNQYPYPIRRKCSDKLISEFIEKTNSYVQCCLNCKTYRKHRIIAQQFIPNPNNLPQVDHINHNKQDNRIENLRQVSISENNKNKSSSNGHQYTFIDELPDTAEPLEFYNNHEFDDLWIDYGTQKLYIRVANKYRELLEHKRKFSSFFVAYDREGKHANLSHGKLFD